MTDATAALVQAADAADSRPSATARVRELEAQVAQLRSDLRSGGGGGRGASGASPGQKGTEQLQGQLKMARQMVLEAEERACVAEVRVVGLPGMVGMVGCDQGCVGEVLWMQRKVEVLEARCQKLQADAEACGDRMRAAEVRASDAQAALRRRSAPAPDSGAGADRAAAAAALRSAHREAATSAAAAAAAEAREAAALAQVAEMEEAAEDHGRLVAQVAALQGRVDDTAAEQARAAHFQKVRVLPLLPLTVYAFWLPCCWLNMILVASRSIQ